MNHPNVDLDGFKAEFHLPLIDLSLLAEGHLHDLENLCRQIREACEDWGFFRVINHGIDQSLVDCVDSVARQLFALPAEVKETAVSPLPFSGYAARSLFSPYGESMNFPRILQSDSIQQYSDKLWPQGNPQFCEALRAYSLKLTELANTSIKLILLSMDPKICKYFESDFGKGDGNLRMNYFSPFETPTEVVGFNAHKDISPMAMLYQDDVGGLEIRSKHGDWFSVKPLPNSFVINIGDSFKMMNFNDLALCMEGMEYDRLWSAEHRVVYGGVKPRLSVGFFWNFADEMEVRAPEELIDHEHPQRYKPFVFKDYVESIAQGIPVAILL